LNYFLPYSFSEEEVRDSIVFYFWRFDLPTLEGKENLLSLFNIIGNNKVNEFNHLKALIFIKPVDFLSKTR